MCLGRTGGTSFFALRRERPPARYGAATTAAENWDEIVSDLAPISKGDHYAAFVTGLSTTRGSSSPRVARRRRAGEAAETSPAPPRAHLIHDPLELGRTRSGFHKNCSVLREGCY